MGSHIGTRSAGAYIVLSVWSHLDYARGPTIRHVRADLQAHDMDVDFDLTGGNISGLLMGNVCLHTFCDLFGSKYHAPFLTFWISHFVCILRPNASDSTSSHP